MGMTSIIARAVGLETEPVALIWSDTKPEGALELRKDAWGCVMWLYAKVAREGRTAVFSRETYGCAGGATGLGFGRPIDRHIVRTDENFCSFLSNGIEEAKDRGEYAAIVENAGNPNQKKALMEGERIMKSPAVVRKFLESLPVYDVPAKYVVMKPLSLVQENETIQTVTFLANADQISALSILANYHAGTITDRVVVAAGAAGCQALGVCTYRESVTADPRAVIGLTDIMARRMTRNLLGKDKLTFSVPFELYCEMEKNVPGSFLELDGWRELRDAK